MGAGDGHGQRLLSEVLGCRNIDVERLWGIELRVRCDDETWQKGFRDMLGASVLVGKGWRWGKLRDVRDVGQH